jgi:phage terminase large subunit-like protein
MVEFRQGFRSMAAPTRELEKLIVSRKLAHGGNPVTRWMAANVAVAQDPAGNLKPAKDKSTERIDGIVAAIMAIAARCRPGGAATGVLDVFCVRKVPTRSA